MVSVLCQLAEERIVEFMDGGLRINNLTSLRRSQEFDQRCTGQD